MEEIYRAHNKERNLFYVFMDIYGMGSICSVLGIIVLSSVFSVVSEVTAL